MTTHLMQKLLWNYNDNTTKVIQMGKKKKQMKKIQMKNHKSKHKDDNIPMGKHNICTKGCEDNGQQSNTETKG